jgi:oxygen-dependent protoporphyrinogen oxidase
VRTERKDGFLLELGPTVRPAPELWNRSGSSVFATKRCSPTGTSRYVEWESKLHPLPMSPGSLVGTPLLSARGKLRLLAEPFVRRGRDTEESVHAFFARRLGDEVADRFIEPFVGGIFAGSSRDLSITAAFPTLARWDREHGSLLLRGRSPTARRRRGTPRAARSALLPRGLEALPKAAAASPGRRLGTATRGKLSPLPEEGGGSRLRAARRRPIA